MRVAIAAVCAFALGVLLRDVGQDSVHVDVSEPACEPVPQALLLSHPIPYAAVVHQSGPGDPGKPKFYVRKEIK